MAKRYIDFCASNNITAHSLTSTENTTTPWYQQSKPGVEPGPDTDVTRPRDGFDLGAIRRYAESKGVRLWTWVHQGALRGRVEEAFSAFEKLGWSGMMVDFFDHDDQDTVEFAESVLAAAARHHILIHFHGIWKPTGWQRTYPNLMNHEGALNLEYLKWSDRCTPEHDLMMAFTRLIAGPMDYHLGGFRAVPRSEFKPRNVAPNVLGTRGHMLAMYVCFDNPMPMLADYPTAYEGQAGFDFLKRVPTWWDETRVPIARVGELLVTARRSGRTWYLGGLSAKAMPNIRVPLTFLPPGHSGQRSGGTTPTRPPTRTDWSSRPPRCRRPRASVGNRRWRRFRGGVGAAARIAGNTSPTRSRSTAPSSLPTRLTVRILPRVSRGDVQRLYNSRTSQRCTALATNSGPLSLRRCSGAPLYDDS
jgi:alpha-glucosidase